MAGSRANERTLYHLPVPGTYGTWYCCTDGILRVSTVPGTVPGTVQVQYSTVLVVLGLRYRYVLVLVGLPVTVLLFYFTVRTACSWYVQ